MIQPNRKTIREWWECYLPMTTSEGGIVATMLVHFFRLNLSNDYCGTVGTEKTRLKLVAFMSIYVFDPTSSRPHHFWGLKAAFTIYRYENHRIEVAMRRCTWFWHLAKWQGSLFCWLLTFFLVFGGVDGQGFSGHSHSLPECMKSYIDLRGDIWGFHHTFEEHNSRKQDA